MLRSDVAFGCLAVPLERGGNLALGAALVHRGFWKSRRAGVGSVSDAA